MSDSSVVICRWRRSHVVVCHTRVLPSPSMQPEEKTIVVSFRLPVALVKKLDARAKSEDRTRNKVAARILTDALARIRA